MSHYRASLPLGLAALNAALVFAIWFGALVALANEPARVASAVAMSLMPVCAVVAWRSTRHVQRLLAGTATAMRAIAEGAACGAALGVGLFLLNWLAPSALAAGHPLDGFRPTEATDWLVLIVTLGPLAAIAAAVGAVHGYALHKLSLYVVRRMNEA